MKKRNPLPKMLSAYFAQLGRKSAKAKMTKLTPERRREIAANAAAARWGPKPKKKGQK